AEKVQAMVQLGMANSRMKDFFEVRALARAFAGPALRAALAATFTRRATAIPTEIPVALSEAFAQDESKQKQWAAFLTRNGLDAEAGALAHVVAELAGFLIPPLMAAAQKADFRYAWALGRPWRPETEDTPVGGGERTVG